MDRGSFEALGDVDARDFRAAAHRVADMVADYLEGVERYPVSPSIRPGDVTRQLSAAPPDGAEPLDRILDDYASLIEPNVTHWNHPGFLAYFATSGSGPGILGETLAAALNVNTMLWRTGPVSTELEVLVCDWLRQMLDLPGVFRGHINDTASMSTLIALGSARHLLGDLDVKHLGMAGRPDMPRLTIYASDQAHSSVDKAAIVLGLGLEQVRKVSVDDAYRMRPEALNAAIAADRAAGGLPLAVVATAGTTSTTSIDPLAPIAAICAEEGLWLHVDAAYGGAAAICPELRPAFAGLERADSIVVNPHKWLFTPIDCSVLFFRDPEAARDAYSVVPAYLRTDDPHAINLMDYGIQLGKRFRALKLWMVIRAFGVAGLRARIRAHCALAREFADWVRSDPGFELVAPVPLSTVCFRACGTGSEEEDDGLNRRLLSTVNRSGAVLLSSTELGGRVTLRLAVANIRTGYGHVERAWGLIRSTATALRQREAGARLAPRD